jgi:hypothetical protein
MTSYIPDYVYGLIPGTYGKMGLIPWPAHMTPSRLPEQNSASGVELTKKGESYVAAALAEADGVFFLTIDKRDRQSIATTIERLINMLDDLEDDPDLEPSEDSEASLGWTDRGPSAVCCNLPGFPEFSRGPANDDREMDTADNEPWLGSSDTPWPSSQAAWGRGGSDDREGDDEREDTQTEDDAGGVLFCDGSGAQIAMALLNGLHVGGAR